MGPALRPLLIEGHLLKHFDKKRVEGSININHGWTRRRICTPVHWHCQTLQFIHHRWKEELCIGHLRNHRLHHPLLQIEAQETGSSSSTLVCHCVPAKCRRAVWGGSWIVLVILKPCIWYVNKDNVNIE